MCVAKRSFNGIELMKCAEIIEPEPLLTDHKNVVKMPDGLLGFERIKQFELLCSPEEAPFCWLQALDDPTVSFLVLSPFLALPAYQPDLSATDVDRLGLENSEDALIFNIVTMHRNGPPTINLKGPIIINRHTLLARQVIPTNAADYAVQHPVPLGPPAG